MKPAVAFWTIGSDTLTDVHLAEDRHDPDNRLIGVAVWNVVTSNADINERLLTETKKCQRNAN